MSLAILLVLILLIVILGLIVGEPVLLDIRAAEKAAGLRAGPGWRAASLRQHRRVAVPEQIPRPWMPLWELAAALVVPSLVAVEHIQMHRRPIHILVHSSFAPGGA